MAAFCSTSDVTSRLNLGTQDPSMSKLGIINISGIIDEVAASIASKLYARYGELNTTHPDAQLKSINIWLTVEQLLTLITDNDVLIATLEMNIKTAKTNLEQLITGTVELPEGAYTASVSSDVQPPKINTGWRTREDNLLQVI